MSKPLHSSHFGDNHKNDFEICQNAENSVMNGGMQSAINHGNGSINQNQIINYQNHNSIKLEKDTIKSFSRSEIHKQASLNFLLYFICAICVFLFFKILPLLFDINKIYFFVLFLCFFISFSIVKFYRYPYILMFLLRKINCEHYLGQGIFLYKSSNGNCIIYCKSAQCNYSSCEQGIVYLQDPPPREKENHTYIGKCNKGGKAHVYKVSDNFIGIPHTQGFDWRKLNE
ncbi:hypothetical protein cce_1940 [Crocosphaera subtropica ATCC 51142]|uniref:Transmembrane protein n=1 Tax=Crocosphaera subtropica (strain ATCC 51142 / BH68) TaxID=43989 RepID=B1X0K1_CROS5|nr:hypothetical protein [Crocosphaera subtropica]ACB51290.1 hypothetical protein cce_1940 [Crocosphaera subtropica ATCC 51142]